MSEPSKQPVRILRNPNELKKKTRIIDVPSDKDPILAGEEALTALEPNFEHWLAEMINTLRRESKRIERGEMAPLSDTNLFRAAFDIHGQAETMGYASIGKVASMLCTYLEGQQMLTPDGIAVTYQCVETIGAMSRENVRETEHPIAEQLIAALEIFISKKSS